MLTQLDKNVISDEQTQATFTHTDSGSVIYVCGKYTEEVVGVKGWQLWDSLVRQCHKDTILWKEV